MISNVRKKLSHLCSLLLLATVFLCGVSQAQASAEIITVSSVVIESGSVVLNTDSQNVVFKSYTLGAPARLVVDVENALPEFSDRTFSINDGFKDLRIGLYADKTRFVFDALNGVLPAASVNHVNGKLIVSWGGGNKVVEAPIVPGTPNAIQQIDFDATDGKSVFTVTLSSPSDFISPEVDGDIIRFGVKDTVIPRSLRRVVDASVFPSAVLQITPYSTIIDGERSVMFAARMKGPVDYTVNLEGSSLVFRTIDGPFAESPAVKLSTVVVPVEVSQATNTANDSDDVAQVIESLSSSPLNVDSGGTASNSSATKQKVYTGEPVTLVFDDADIRKVMQLIAEISDQNIILSDGVKGKISLRLHDVPWDQAFDLVLEIKELGTINQGNVVRVLPIKQIELMATDRLKAKQSIKRLEQTQTEIFEIVYKDVDTFEDVIEDMLSDQGEVSALDGSKKIMVTDIPSKLVEIREILVLLDEPVKQVLIEARIVEASTGTDLQLGVNWGLSYDNVTGNGDVNSDNTIGLDTADAGLGGNFILPTSIGTSGIGVSGKFLYDLTTLELKLAALEAANELKIVSAPKVLTLDGEEAEISDGVQIPYKTSSDDGPVTEFQDATLSLKVTPEVNPDDSIILTIDVSNSRPGATFSDGTGIDKKEVKTKLLLQSGETSVIGGVYVESLTDSDQGVPILKDIPYLGSFFKSTVDKSSRRELLIFITPIIVQ